MMHSTPAVVSFMPRGSGALVVHQTLAARLTDYRLVSYSPKLEYFPPAMKLLRSGAAGVLHSTPDHGIWFLRPKQKFVATFHNFMLDAGMRPYSSWTQRLHYRTDLRYFTLKSLEQATAVTAVSAYTAELVRQELGFDEPIEVIANAVDTRVFSPAASGVQDGPFVALFCGNLSIRKGVMWLPEIARGLDADIRLRCVVGRSSGRLQGRNIETLTAVSGARMPDVYRRADLLLLPTVREGMSLAILEAMASGLPVVASRCPSVAECVDDGLGGILCDVGDAEGFSAAINRLAADRELSRRMGEYNRSRVEQEFDLPRMVEGYTAVFNDCAGGGLMGCGSHGVAIKNGRIGMPGALGVSRGGVWPEPPNELTNLS